MTNNENTAFELAEIDYENICELNGQINFESGHPGLAVKLEGFGGDGLYQVRGVYDEQGNLIRAIIDFTDENKNAYTSRVIGEVAVDSGQLLITDPCYILK